MGEDTRNEIHDPPSFANLYEDERGDILHCLSEESPFAQHDSFVISVAGGMQKMFPHQTCFLLSDIQICHPEFSLHRSNQHFSCPDGAAISDQFPLVESTSCTENHTAENAPRLSPKYQYHRFSDISELFFESMLNPRVASRYRWSWLPQPKTKFPKQALTLSGSQVDLEFFPNIRRQYLSVPDYARKSYVVRRQPKRHLNIGNLFVAQLSGATRFFLIYQSLKTTFQIGCYPVPYCSLRITEYLGNTRTGHAFCCQKHRMEFVVIAGFFISSDFVLQYKRRRLIVDSYSHAYSILYAILFRQLLMSLCIIL
jgi:hypothetical protein